MARASTSRLTRHLRLLSTTETPPCISSPRLPITSPFDAVPTRRDSEPNLVRWIHKTSWRRGIDYEHWFVAMYEPGGKGATEQQMRDCFIKTLAKVVGSEEEAKKKIYRVRCVPGETTFLGFGCKVDWETSWELQEVPGVAYLLPDANPDPDVVSALGNRNSPFWVFTHDQVSKTPEKCCYQRHGEKMQWKL